MAPRGRWILLSSLLAIVLCLPSAPASAAAVSVRLLPATAIVGVPDTLTIQIAVDPADSVFNAFDLYLPFDSSLVSVVSQPISNQIGPLMRSSCGTSFHKFTPHPTWLEINYSMLCSGVFANGPGVIYQVKFKPKFVPPGYSTFCLGPATTFYKAGFTMLPLATECMDWQLPEVGVPNDRVLTPAVESPAPNPCRAGAPASLAFTLAEPGAVRLDVFDISGRRVGGLAARDYPAGRSVVPLPSQGLAAGTYWLRLSDRGRRIATRTWIVIR